MRDHFDRFARRCAQALGTAWAFTLACISITAWLVSGPLLHWSDTWQLVANTTTTLISYLMIFLLQNTLNRDSAALHLKLDELLRAIDGARTELAGLEGRPRSDVEAARRAVHETPTEGSA